MHKPGIIRKLVDSFNATRQYTRIEVSGLTNPWAKHLEELDDEIKVIEDRLKEQSEKDRFIIQMTALDWYYSYSDSNSTYKSGRDSIARYRELSKEFGLEHVFDMTHEDRNEWFQGLPMIKDRNRLREIQSDDVFKLREYYGLDIDEIAQYKALEPSLAKFIDSLPDDSYGFNCFISTPKTNHKEFREWSLNSQYYGLAVNEKTQSLVDQYFNFFSDSDKALLMRMSQGRYVSFTHGESRYHVAAHQPSDGHFNVNWDILRVETKDKRYYFIF